MKRIVKDATSRMFSIVVPTFNRADLIGATLKTVLAQKYRDFEIIVVDDGSIDNTAEVINNIESDNIKYFYKDNEERAAARNFGIKKALGQYVTFLDSDDILYANHLEVANKIVTTNSSPSFFHIGYEVKDTNGEIIRRVNNREGSLNEQLLYGNSLSCIGVFIRRDIALKHLFNEDRNLSGSEDYELWMRLASRYEIFYSDEITAALIQHEGRSVLGFDKRVLINRIELLMKYLFKDQKFIETYGSKKSIFIAHRYLYLSLHLTMGRYLGDGLMFWWRAFRLYPAILFTRKTAGILKNLVVYKFFVSLASGASVLPL